MTIEAWEDWSELITDVDVVRTWKRRMSRGLPAFFRQFWLHFMKNLRKNLQPKMATILHKSLTKTRRNMDPDVRQVIARFLWNLILGLLHEYSHKHALSC